MSDIPADLYYTEEHEYLKATDEDGVYAVGVTDYAQGELGDVVFVELPDGGSQFGRWTCSGPSRRSRLSRICFARSRERS